MEASSSRRPLHTHISTINGENSVSKRIAEAIRGKTCPICLRHIDFRRAAVISVCAHAFCVDCIRKWSDLKRKCPLCNSDFDSWFFKFSVSSRRFSVKRLPDLYDGEKVDSSEVYSRRRDLLAEQRAIRRSREELNTAGRRTRPFPKQRSFGRSPSLPPEIVAERVIQWRSSIYEQHLQAVPLSSGNSLCQRIAGNDGVKERIQQRIEPWIRRELQALLGDPDPSVIVHVAASVFISSLDEKLKVSSGQIGVKDNFLSPLRPFLHERTSMFWHELRCFAESHFTMETYDTVVEYKRSD